MLAHFGIGELLIFFGACFAIVGGAYSYGHRVGRLEGELLARKQLDEAEDAEDAKPAPKPRRRKRTSDGDE